MKKPKINTMKQLSAAINVSRPTLSRYFQDPDSVSPSSAERIRRGLETVDYVPNFFFTRLNRKTTGLIGVIIPHLGDAYYASLLDVIETEAVDAGFTIIIQSSHGDPQTEARAIETLLSMHPDGVLVAPLGKRSSVEAFDRLKGSVPFVFIDSRLHGSLADVDFVGSDNKQSIGMIVNYLCRTGQPPAFLSMPRVNSNSQEREAAYLSQMESLGHEATIIDGSGVDPNWRFEDYALRVMESHFSRGRYVDATILCANDRLAFGAIRAANNQGLFPSARESRGPLRIAGHDDNPISRFMSPSLTTVAQDVEAIGREAVKALTKRVHEGDNALGSNTIKMCDAALQLRGSA